MAVSTNRIIVLCFVGSEEAGEPYFGATALSGLVNATLFTFGIPRLWNSTNVRPSQGGISAF